MISINLNNVEKIVFHNKDLQKHLPGLKKLFHQWRLSYQFPQLKPLRQKILLELLDTIDEKTLQEYFREEVYVQKLKNITTHISVNIDESEQLNSVLGNFCISRNATTLYLTSWK